MYFITTIETKKGEVSDTRCVGYVSTLEEAMEIVVNNRYDIWETCYKYAIIEHIPEGIYQYDQNPIWFEYNDKTGKYMRRKGIPSFVDKRLVGFAIG